MRHVGPAVVATVLAVGLIAAPVALTGPLEATTPLPRGESVLATVRPGPPSPPRQRPAIRDPEGVSRTLDEVATAFARADPDRLRPWLADPGGDLGRRWMARARNLAGVPLASYRLELDRSLPDLATRAVRADHTEPVQVVAVEEQHALEDLDSAGPASDYLFLTLVEREGRWLVASDTDAQRLGLTSARHLWDLGPVEVTRRGAVVALHRPGTPDAAELAEATRRALHTARDRWPLAWPRNVALVVPRDEDELRELLGVSFDVSDFLAFATGTLSGEHGDYEVTGPRIVLNPVRFRGFGTETRERILVHELLHVATRPVTGPLVPAWLDEGVAQALGERQSTTGTGLLDRLPAEDLRLPLDEHFTVGDSERIHLSYQLAYSFVEYLRSRDGEVAVARFYAEAGEGADGQPGNTAWHLDRAAREVFGASLSQLVAGWRASRSSARR